jgi:hypothetical protein
MKHHVDLKIRNVEFKVGDLVMLKLGKRLVARQYIVG